MSPELERLAAKAGTRSHCVAVAQVAEGARAAYKMGNAIMDKGTIKAYLRWRAAQLPGNETNSLTP